MEQKAHHLKSTKAPYLGFAPVPLAEVLQKQSKLVLQNTYIYIFTINSQSQKKIKNTHVFPSPALVLSISENTLKFLPPTARYTYKTPTKNT